MFGTIHFVTLALSFLVTVAVLQIVLHSTCFL